MLDPRYRGPPPRRPRRRPRSWLFGTAAAAAAVVALFLYLGDVSAPSRSSDAEEMAQISAAQVASTRVSLARLRSRVEELELRLKVLEDAGGYTATTGERLPAVMDPLATARPPAP